MNREDTALVCGIHGLDIFWHLFCFPTPTLGKAGWSSQFLLQPGSWPLLSLRVLTLVFGAGWQTRLVGRCGIHSANTDIFGPATIFQLWSKASSSRAVSRAGLLSALSDDVSTPATAPHEAPGSDGPPCPATLVCEGVMHSHCSSQDRSTAQTVTSGRGTVTNPQSCSGHSSLQSQCLLLANKYTIFFPAVVLFFLFFKSCCFPTRAVGSRGFSCSNVNTATVCPDDCSLKFTMRQPMPIDV